MTELPASEPRVTNLRVTNLRVVNLRVIKLGGSLLDWADLAQRVRAWRKLQPPAIDLLIVGGGRLADAVREYDRVHGLTPLAANHLAIRSMSLSTAMVAQLLPEATIVEERAALGGCGLGELLLFDTTRFLELEESRLPGLKLPASWDATSDSIAARVAQVMGAVELVLLKSTIEPAASSLEELTAAGVVDRLFARMAASLPVVRLVNLRDGAFAELSFRLASVFTR